MDSEKMTAFVQERPQGNFLPAGHGAGGRGCLEHGTGGAVMR